MHTHTHTPKGISVCSKACCAITSPNKIVLTGKLFTGHKSLNRCLSARLCSTHHHQSAQWMNARLSCTQQNRLYPTTHRECVGNQTSSLACSTMYPSSPNKLPILYCAIRLTIKKRTDHRSDHQPSIQTRHLSSFSSIFVHSRFTAQFTSQKPNYFSQWNVCLYKVKAKKRSLYRPVGPYGFRRLRLPEFLYNRHMNMVM